MARSKKPAGPGDMIRSLAVILIPVVAITYFFTRSPDAPPVAIVDYGPALTQAREQAPFPVLAPAAVPTSWRATKATWLPEGRGGLNGEPSPRNLWQLGFLNADEIYVEVNQGDLEAQDLISERTRDGLPDGSSDVNGQTWERLISTDERTRSLVARSPSVTTVVVGDVPYAELESFTATLRPS